MIRSWRKRWVNGVCRRSKKRSRASARRINRLLFLEPLEDRTVPSGVGNGLIAFDTNRDGNFEIYAMNADGSNPTRLTNTSANEDLPAWSPDSSKIAFASNRDGTQDIYVMNADGGNQTRLTSSADVDFNAAWSPDGSKIAFQRGDGTNTKNDIYVMNADGSGQTNITNNTANNDQPAWSPDGSEIAFTTSRDGNFELYSMNADGSNQTRLTNNSAVDTEPAWQPVPLLSNQSPIAHAGGPYIIN